jgi:hypothetical protein
MVNTLKVHAAHNSGSLFFNYKNTFYIILLALVDANCKTATIDVDGQANSSDGGLFTTSYLGKSPENSALNIPNSKPPPALFRRGRRSISPKEIFATTLPGSFNPEQCEQA